MGNIKINQGTQSPIAVDTVGTVNYQVIKLDYGTVGATTPFQGTIPEVTTIGSVSGVGGTVKVDIAGTEPIIVEVGTIAAGTINSSTVNTGTINTGTIDLLKAGTITALANGTIGAGTLNTLGTLSKLESGSISVIAGTVNAGTIDLLKAGTITTLPDLPGGTIDAVSSLTNGSIIVTASTVSAGTINVFDNLLPAAFNNIAIGYPDGTTETYTYKTGTTPTGTITVVYLDAAKGSISTVTKS